MREWNNVPRKIKDIAYIVNGLMAQFTKSVRPTGLMFRPAFTTCAKSIPANSISARRTARRVIVRMIVREHHDSAIAIGSSSRSRDSDALAKAINVTAGKVKYNTRRFRTRPSWRATTPSFLIA